MNFDLVHYDLGLELIRMSIPEQTLPRSLDYASSLGLRSAR